MDKNSLTTDEKKLLLKNYLTDEISFKAIVETLSPQELENYIDTNLDCLLKKAEVSINV